MPKSRKKAMKHYHNKSKNFNRGQGEFRNYDLPAKENELFTKYYQGLGIVPEGEWEEFDEVLKKTLPVTFRITGYRSQAQELLSNIKGKFFSSLVSQTVDGEAVPPPTNLPWYPNNLGWKVDLSRKIVRSHECFSRLHDFLVAETECGAISRQEAVSMIPPLVMDIESHHKILDMCAAPGSKTAQLIEYLHSSCTGDELPTGYVVANDSDNKRCYLMVHQVKRLQSPSFMIVNHDATIFPKIRTTSDESRPEFVLFDRILCDVPCSGDGTMRKNMDVWAKWHPLQGANMHGLQSKILRRGSQLLAVGGRLVYSTCSLNPVEDEAVVAEMLRSANGAMELIDITSELPGLKYTKGISHWKVMTRTGEWIECKDDVPAAMKTQYKHTIFAPTPEEAETFHLDRCMRILPHHQDTGGFFIAALRKVHHLPGSREARLEAEAAERAAEKAPEKEVSGDAGKEASEANDAREKKENGEGEKKERPVGDEPPKKKQRVWGFKEDPFLFMKETDPIWPTLRDFFGLSDFSELTSDFPMNQIMFRSEQGKRTLYFVSKAIREIVAYNENAIKFINMGVKAFSRSPSPLVPDCDFRISQECLATLLPAVNNRRVNVTKKDAITVISEENPFTHKLSEGTRDQLKMINPGSAIFVFTPSEEEPSPACEILFCGWHGKSSVRCFGSRCERSHSLMLLGEDLKEINKRVAEEKKAREQERMEGTLDQERMNDDIPPFTEEMPVKSETKMEEMNVDDDVREEMTNDVKEEIKKDDVKEEIMDDVKEEIMDDVKKEIKAE